MDKSYNYETFANSDYLAFKNGKMFEFCAEKLVSDVLFLEVLVISCIISKKNVTFVMRSLLK